MAQNPMNLPFDEWLPRQRWYGGRSRELSTVEPVVSVPLGDDLELALLDVTYSDGADERYQVIVRWADAPIDGLGAAAVIGTAGDGDRVAHDALYDPAAAGHLLSLIDQSAAIDGVTF